MAGQEAVAMTPTSDMSLDDIIRELEAQRDRTHEAMLQFVVDGLRHGNLYFGRTDFEDDDQTVDLRMSGVDAYSGNWDEANAARISYMNDRLKIGSELDAAKDALARAVALRDALEGEA